MQLLVRSITLEAEDILSFELVHPDRAPLPPFTAGSHVDVTVMTGSLRQYSLCNDPREAHRYRIAVLREPNGRGGSSFMHDQVRVGERLEVSSPRNNFPLHEAARRHLLIAGGVGVTPLLAMAHQLNRQRADYEMHYCARSAERAAFVAELTDLRQEVRFHYDGGDPRRGLDIAGLLRDPAPGTHVYCCGPTGFMQAVSNASAHWPAQTIHFEYFTPPAPAAAPGPETSGEFEVELASNHAVYAIPPGQSILSVLRAAGLTLDSSCEAGVCGTCRTRYLRGEPDHRDFVLSDEERRDWMMLCVSRARRGERILLDC